ncbi:hypothetical protein BUE80_DR010078, partial [Diplocarpon rosae]
LALNTQLPPWIASSLFRTAPVDIREERTPFSRATARCRIMLARTQEDYPTEYVHSELLEDEMESEHSPAQRDITQRSAHREKVGRRVWPSFRYITGEGREEGEKPQTPSHQQSAKGYDQHTSAYDGQVPPSKHRIQITELNQAIAMGNAPIESPISS